jgi:hypothetical protein
MGSEIQKIKLLVSSLEKRVPIKTSQKMNRLVFILIFILANTLSLISGTVTVTNLTDIVNGNTASIAALIASDGGDGISYREAVRASNNTIETNIINVSVSGTITLLSDMDNIIGGNIAINGNGLILDGDAQYNYGSAQTIIATLNDLVFYNGGGGEIFDYIGFGGQGELFTMNNCVFDSNDSGNSNVFECDDPICILNRCIFSNNVGKHIYRMCEEISIMNNCVFDNNHSTDGGIYFHEDGYSEINASLFINNSTDSILVLADAFDSLILIRNTTFSGNQVTGSGDHMFLVSAVDERMELINCTIDNNVVSGGAFVFGIEDMDSLVIKNTIVSNTGDPAFYFDNPSGTITSINNIFEGYTGSVPYKSNADPLLGPLQNNGGPTETHALLAGSPAINMGNIADCPELDQRGYFRNGTCDIGAFEFEGTINPIPSMTTWGIIILMLMFSIFHVVYYKEFRLSLSK